MSILLGSKFTREDRQLRSFRSDPVNTNLTLQAVEIIQAPGDTIEVTLTTGGSILDNIYNEVNAVPVATKTLVVSYTIPVGKEFTLNSVVCSGDNLAKFVVEINSAVIQARRSWWTNFNVDFDIKNLIVNAGDIIELFVENKGTTAVTFDGTIIGGESDA